MSAAGDLQGFTTKNQQRPDGWCARNKLCCCCSETWSQQMPNRKANRISLIALAGAVVLMSGAAQAQYLTRHQYRSVQYPYARAQYTVLPPTIVNSGMIGVQSYAYDPYGNLPSVFGCCATTHNEHIG